MTTRLFTTAVQPFSGSYEDFYSKSEDMEDGDEGAVLTVMTVSSQFNDIFQAQYLEGEGYDKEKVSEQLPDIGPVEDNPEDDFRGYSIIVPKYDLVVADLQKWVEKLNEEFDEDFELWTECLVCGEEMPIEDRFKPEVPVAEHEEWKKGKPFCDSRCFRHYTGHSRINKKDIDVDEENLVSLEEFKEEIQED